MQAESMCFHKYSTRNDICPKHATMHQKCLCNASLKWDTVQENNKIMFNREIFFYNILVMVFRKDKINGYIYMYI